MRLNSNLSAVLSGQFLLEESAAAAFLLQVTQLLTTAQSAPAAQGGGAPEPPVCFAITAEATSIQLRPYGSLDDVPAGSIAVTLVSGVMMPEDDYDWDCGYVPGTRTLASRIQQADAHPNIAGHVGWFRTPGGSTMGLEHFANVIAATTKPFVSFVEMMCSAGLWAGCGADKIVIARTGIAGSIGTKWDALDFSGYYEKLGIKQVTVTATDSTDKTKAFDEALKGKATLLRSQLLDPLNDEFVSRVKTMLPDAGDDTLTGKLYVGQYAIDAGLAHELGGLQDAIQLAFDLADAAGPVATTTTFSLSPTPSPTIMGLFDKNKTTAFAAVLGLAGKTGLTADTTKAANEELVAAGITDAALISQADYTALSEKAGRVDAAEKTATDLKATVTTLTADKTRLTTDLEASQAEVTRLGALGGAVPTNAGKVDGDRQEATKAHAWLDPKAQHNLDAEKLLG